MDTIIVKPRSNTEYKEVISLLKKLKIKTEVYQSRSKEDILKSIEKGAKSTALYLQGKIQLQDAKDLLSEL
jgi:hypothetical protein